jgi:2Fe-2S ferredoxin
MMPKITFIAHNGDKSTIDINNGESLMFGATNNGVGGIIGECGGFCSCATCHVYIDEAWISKLPAISEHEDEMLEGTVSDRTEGSRLSCQIQVTDEMDGMIVRTPEFQSI